MKVEYTDKDGREVLISQNEQNKHIMISEKVKEDTVDPLGRTIPKGNYRMIFHSQGDKDGKVLDWQGLIDFYENDYKKLEGLLNDENLKEYLKNKKAKNKAVERD